MGVIFHQMAQEERRPEVVLVKSGKSADGHDMYDVVQTFQVKAEVHAKEKQGLQHGELLATHDEFYIVRPANS